jgi:hypothetical protein
MNTVNHRRRSRAVALVLAASMAALVLVVGPRVPPARAADEDSETELAKKTQNPVADLISVPFQSNFNFNTGTKDATVYVLNVQPVIPFHLTENWNLIARTIVPIINQPSLVPHMESAFGMGDINPTLFLSPAKPGTFFWGVGPTLTLPTATDRLLASGKWSLGPAAVGLMMQGPWVYGVLVSQQWSFAGWGHKDVNQMVLQPFVNYNLGNGWALSMSPLMTGNWTARASDQWTVPVGGGVSKLFKLGKLPINTSLQAYYNADRPKNASDWQLRFQVQFLLPSFK